MHALGVADIFQRQRIKVRQNVSKRLKARQMCGDDDDDENAISKRTSLINCTEHPTQIRGCVLVPRTQ